MINNNDYEDCVEHFNSDAYITIKSWKESQKFLFFHVKGLEGTPYEGGVFKFQIDLEDEFREPPLRIKLDEIKSMVEERIKQRKGLISEEGALYVVAKELSVEISGVFENKNENI